MDTNSSENLKHYFWKKLAQFKYDLIFYSLQFEHCVVWLRCIKIGSASLTALATGAWMGWHNVKLVSVGCPIIILILQALAAGTESLPFDARKIDLREMIDLLDPIYDKMELTWENIVIGDLTAEEIRNATHEFQTKVTDIKSRFLKNDTLPQNKRITQKAKECTDIYFKNLSGGN